MEKSKKTTDFPVDLDNQERAERVEEINASLDEHVRHLLPSDIEQIQRYLEKIFKERRNQLRCEARDAAEAAARKYGFGLRDVTTFSNTSGSKNSSGSTQKGVAKFQNQSNPSQTWTGRGRKPKWVQRHIDAGGSLEDLRIQ